MEDDFESTLHTAPSFAIYNNSHGEFADDEDEVLKRTTTMIGGQSIEAKGSSEFSFGRKRMMDLIGDGEDEKLDELIGIQNLGVEVEPASPPMYVAAGLGVDDGAGFGSDNLTTDNLFTPNLREIGDLEEYYKRMVDEYPCHPFFLKEFANILQSKGDLHGAEEYLIRATLADPDDGETLMRYAKLVWEHHHDKDRALGYFERATQSAPLDSHVLAAYACFLWETEDDENDVGQHETQNDYERKKTDLVKPPKEESGPLSVLATGHEIDAANLTTANRGNDNNAMVYFKKMIDENPNNPLFLKQYAQFLFQSKRYLEAAEDYYARAISDDPTDSEMMSEYAKLEWELHHERGKALFLFEQAVQATPGNSNVLAAYARFLWETEDGES